MKQWTALDVNINVVEALSRLKIIFFFDFLRNAPVGIDRKINFVDSFKQDPNDVVNIR